MAADAVFRVGRAYGMTADRRIYQAVAVTDGRITAVGQARDELDSFIGPGTAVVDDPELVLYPAFADTHNHQLLAARDLDCVPLEQARSIGELVQALREAAARTPPGQWIVSSRCWHETHLREGRLPTARELDAASLVPGEVAVYRAVADRGELTTRTRLMFWVGPVSGDGGLGIWGLKLGMDGGVEGGFLCQPYANNPGFRGHAFWEPDDFEQVVEHAVGRGWRVGCHAVGDCAVHRVLDAYERVASRHPDLAPGTLVIEHAFLADAGIRARAVRLGVGITVQHPLLSIWGLVTRGTRTVGVQGPEYRVDTYTAIRLYTEAGGRLLREDGSVGVLTPGAFADIVGFRGDLLDCPVDDLPTQQPALTMVGGRPVHDPGGMVGAG
jgi:predicted amidohydrolase YtcJ